MADRSEPFLSRWSRLKREAAKPAAQLPAASSASDQTASATPAAPILEENAQPAANPGSEGGKAPEQPALDLEKLDFDSLDASSDYTPFMQANVPDEIRSKALAKLWLSDPVLSAPEQLCDYMQDFGDAACAVPIGTLNTAYKIGQGFLSDTEAAEWDRLGRKGGAAGAAPPAAVPVVVGAESPDQPEILALLAASDAHARSLYPAESTRLADLTDLAAPDVSFFVARHEGKALGCGALVIADDGTGELASLWVAPEQRGQGVGRKLLEAIEALAREKSLDILRLKTGPGQPEAIALYRRCGFTACPPFANHHQPDPLILFMEKELV